MIQAETVRFNNDQTIKTEAGKFYVNQRLSGYAENDGKWVVEQLQELYWSPIGVLRRKRRGAFVGVFDTIKDAEDAIKSATLQPINDEMVL